MEVSIIFNYGHYVVLAIIAALLASMFGAFIFFAMRGTRLEREAAIGQARSDQPAKLQSYDRSASRRGGLTR